jgi:hypothetical protein
VHKEYHILASVLLAAAVIPAPTVADQLVLGSEIRCLTTEGEHVRGRLASLTDSSLVIELRRGGFLGNSSYRDSVTFGWSEVQSLGRLESRRNYAVVGMVVGILGGLALGSKYDERNDQTAHSRPANRDGPALHRQPSRLAVAVAIAAGPIDAAATLVMLATQELRNLLLQQLLEPRLDLQPSELLHRLPGYR